MRRIVIDANVGLSRLLPLPYSESADRCFLDWARVRARLYVPALWEYEVVTGLRRAVSLRFLTADEAQGALDLLAGFPLEVVAASADLHRSALQWASRLGHTKAYDSQYLALAEHLAAEFWTADLRLAEAVNRLGIEWTHTIHPIP